MSVQGSIVKRGRKQFIDIVKILPERMPSSGHKICWKELGGGFVKIFVDKRGFEGGSRAKEIVIKRFIPVSELLFEGLGLLMGDGIKFSQGQFKIFGFSNNQIELHEHFLLFSKDIFGLEPELFRARVMIASESQDMIDEIVREFSKRTKIPIKNFNKPEIRRVRKPCFDIQFCSIILGTIIQILLKNLHDSLISNRIFAASFLRGLIASEGSVDLGIRERLEVISIAAKRSSERTFIKTLLKVLQIVPDKDGDGVVLITGFSNFKIMSRWNLLKLHPEKHSKFKLGISRIKFEEFRKGEGKLLILKLLSSQPRTVRELCKILNRTAGSIRSHHLIDLEKSGFVRRKGRVNNRRIWKITKKGLKVLQEENPLERLKHINFKD